MKDWGANVVRLSLSQDFWLKKARRFYPWYKSNVRKCVNEIRSLGMYVILDLHWSDDGDLNQTYPSQKVMADENSIQFWKEVAFLYKNDTSILFELYNEPQLLSYKIWMHGGTHSNGKKYVGMQQLYDAVRSMGAENVVIVNGVKWAYDLSGIKNQKINGYNIMLGTHPYDFQDKQSMFWDQQIGFASTYSPIIATEFGEFKCNDTFVKYFLNYADLHNIHWTAWAWYPKDCSFPSIISDWDGTPNKIGVLIKHALQGNNTLYKNSIVKPLNYQEDFINTMK
ncbi:hypothetical protein DICPUDRAFT_91906 [Dictyostelium purpureum]|uniref:Glycoside hydrolase family 5 domain-containing protein n=1 Tax=Dictyostelium purpureum TaxID=5786 RepID=F0ZJ19_DICPU|nr:uncharacterized protein DICPUDRAFT_91906 [Dictyostelium purpureum]EGC36048.1 hypothetical protein DICPUDRAFT_91906 [Dictyostelium purpureum]|eukprot:XP_003287423.1 hypothetical protein DICPUDRAFT_91906 [Dictyostelium purpureum]